MQPIYWFVAEVDARNAGYRVRTLPIVTELRAQGLAIELKPLAEMVALVPQIVGAATAVVVSKPSDTSTFLCMRHFANQRIPVVIDLFDNYFSWSSALAKRQLHWQWLRGLDTASAIVCSSSYLRNVVASLTDKPVIEVADDLPRPAGRQLEPSQLDTKWAAPPLIELLWFGISGNPYYVAGLDDLASWGMLLRRLCSQVAGVGPVRLTICTNRVPAVDSVLAELRAHEIEARFVEWSEPVCSALIDASHVVLLPTNLSGFSLAKTHNRCTDALLGGCLVLASPNGPYQGLGGAVFDDPDLLASVVARVGGEGVGQLIAASFKELRRRHDLAGDAAKLKKALLSAREPGFSRQRVLIIGRVRGELAKFSRTIGYSLAGFAGSPLQLNYDFRLESLEDHGGLATVKLSDRGWTLVERALSSDPDADLQDFDDRIECRVAGWRMHLQREAKALVVEQGLDATQIAALDHVQRGERGNSSARIAAWFTAHVDVMAGILCRVGLRDIDFATDEDDGWEPFARRAEPRLAALHERLRAHWVRHEGNELAWGRPAQEVA